MLTRTRIATTVVVILAGIADARAEQRTLGAAYASTRDRAKKDTPKPKAAAPATTPGTAATPASRPLRGASPKWIAKVEEARGAAAGAAEKLTRTEAEHQAAREAEQHAKLEADAAGDKAKNATRRLKALAKSVGQAQRAYQLAELDVLQAEEDVRDSRRFWQKIRDSWGAMLGEKSAEQLARDQLRQARGVRDYAAEQLAVLQEQAQLVQREVLIAEAEHEQVRGKVGQVAGRAHALSGAVKTARKDHESAVGMVARLEQAADEATTRRQALHAKLDQHRLALVDRSPADKTRYRQAAERFKLATYIESKPGETSQDAVSADPERGWFAIADGVTNSSYPGQLARALVSAWTTSPPERLEDFGQWLGGVQGRWKAETSPLIAEKKTTWYNRGRDFDAHSTFVGARLIPGPGGKQKLALIGIGDSVAFVVRKGAIVKSFPLTHSSEFSNYVEAIPSKGTPPFPLKQETWEVEPGDEVFMATDALAHWIFAEVEQGRDGFQPLREIKSHPQMTRFVEGARASSMNTDDTSFIRFVVPSRTAQDKENRHE